LIADGAHPGADLGRLRQKQFSSKKKGRDYSQERQDEQKLASADLAMPVHFFPAL
jgi:hypothetical protein